MSVRRLAESQFQPAAFAFSDENSAWVDRTIRKYPEGRQQSAVIPVLMRAQDQEGWVTKAAIEKVADILGMAYIRVLEIANLLYAVPAASGRQPRPCAGLRHDSLHAARRRRPDGGLQKQNS